MRKRTPIDGSNEVESAHFHHLDGSDLFAHSSVIGDNFRFRVFSGGSFAARETRHLCSRAAASRQIPAGAWGWPWGDSVEHLGPQGCETSSRGLALAIRWWLAFNRVNPMNGDLPTGDFHSIVPMLGAHKQIQRTIRLTMVQNQHLFGRRIAADIKRYSA